MHARTPSNSNSNELIDLNSGFLFFFFLLSNRFLFVLKRTSTEYMFMNVIVSMVTHIIFKWFIWFSDRLARDAHLNDTTKINLKEWTSKMI